MQMHKEVDKGKRLARRHAYVVTSFVVEVQDKHDRAEGLGPRSRRLLWSALP